MMSRKEYEDMRLSIVGAANRIAIDWMLANTRHSRKWIRWAGWMDRKQGWKFL